MSFDIFNPETLEPPRGWNNGMLAPSDGRLLLIAGQTARGADGRVREADFVTQFGRALENILAVVAQAGGKPTDIGRMTVFVTDIEAYRNGLGPLGKVWRERMGRHFPAMALMEVSRLVDPNAVVEIEATAVIPPPDSLREPRPQPA